MKYAARYAVRRTLFWLFVLAVVCLGVYTVDFYQPPQLFQADFGITGYENYELYEWLTTWDYLDPLFFGTYVAGILALALLAIAFAWLIPNVRIRRIGYLLLAAFAITGISLATLAFVDQQRKTYTCEQWRGNPKGHYYPVEMDCDEFREWMERSF